jgi:hypothetical protein
MKTFQLLTTSGEEILLECDELHCDLASGRVLVITGDEMKAYVDSTILSVRELAPDSGGGAATLPSVRSERPSRPLLPVPRVIPPAA